ncbi:Uncharacterised protein [Porphyromonas crevioricanis]|uniref:Uncharacterized protein n=1 Tax=Porphyromonas crevioricanis TaxID=393921 RepID=A0A2X4PN71_9PORP|nr:hypothetical protein [Porphyromonas crevioricanis]GAD07140.1 hypothetical protein PORCAN_757 [Porphyromonas crevioricanis JCM 13913]SQH73018.1 Uncharacterised protein [Porphyromonas crevioricanis]
MKQIEQIKLAFLWLLVVTGIISHSVFSLDSLFYGANIQLPGTDGSEPTIFVVSHIVFGVGSLLMVLLTLLIESRGFVWFNRIWASLMGLLNAVHLIATFGESPFCIEQILLLSFVLATNIVLVVRLWKPMESKPELETE